MSDWLEKYRLSTVKLEDMAYSIEISFSSSGKADTAIRETIYGVTLAQAIRKSCQYLKDRAEKWHFIDAVNLRYRFIDPEGRIVYEWPIRKDIG